ncbi:MAG: tetrathionate reductase family octaheme c-type cytochrome [Anaerolineae bacterium]|nr:MAG: tetrathionate reductase family octaheme c-type cytochrome [Anaerolineae bacterium]
MKKKSWIFGLLLIALVVIIPLALFAFPRDRASSPDPWDFLPEHPTHTDHSNIIEGPFETPQQVTQACLECHEEAASEVMHTTHWTWQSQPFDVPWRDEPVTIGKFNQINNFCISTAGNESKCMTCHIGYAWDQYPPKGYDFSVAENVDCLVCHADKATYAKGGYGNPADSVDLLAAARSVGVPTRDNCGGCHFNGGGGNGVKHGDLDESLYRPDEQLDVHMGKFDFLCTDCHRTSDHQIKGRLLGDNYTIDPAEQVQCTDCHVAPPHEDERLNAHLASVACQTCHIPAMARKNPTKTFWDWSQAGEDRGDDHYTYLKIKGEFIYERDVTPAYLWFNGNNEYRYLVGDPINADGPTYINKPAGSIDDPNAKIFPFKIMETIQPYDPVNGYLLTPITAGEGGYWHDFDWDKAFRLAEERLGLPYSGQYDWTETRMYYPESHMIAPAAEALQCNDCHGPEGRMDWEALGYPGDPVDWGARTPTP